MADDDDSELKEKLKEKLKEIFQFENEDLDFGIYRIMNYKRKEIEEFIEKKLIDEIKKQLNQLSEDKRKEIEEKLNKISSKNGVKKYLEALQKEDTERAKIYREDFKEDIEEYEKLKKQLEEVKISEELEKEIYNHLINFFSRYYDEGDFISMRRYGKNERYVVPYNGEEILLYWANKDQYYIKTTEYFRKYTFKVNGNLTVNFRVVEAEEEKGNIKSPEKKFFVLNEKVFDFDEIKKELNIYFEYRGLTEEEVEKYKHGQSPSQDKINEEIIHRLKEKLPENSPARLIFENKNGKTLIEKHLYRYTRRNTTDYFIHKDLKGFLERELDFYIKNEFLNLDDLGVLEKSEYFDKLRLYLIGANVFRNIALTIIEFLAQIENFQKKIWEKKKFVIETHYVITLDKIKEYAGEEFLERIVDEILNNEKQLAEWKELFGIEVKKKADLIEKNTLDGNEWKKLPVDTRHFDEDFKWRLLTALTKNKNLDEILDGVLIKSENFQALNLLLNKYYEKVQTIYIDPPFNKEQEADYLYKVGYKDSTWATMLENRIRLAKDLLSERGSIFVRCDYNGNWIVRPLMDEIFGKENFRNEIVVSRTKTAFYLYAPPANPKNLSPIYDNIYWYSKTASSTFSNLRKGITPEKKDAYWKDFKTFYPREEYRYELLGIMPEEGCSWMWKQEEAIKAAENYQYYKREIEPKGISLEEYWLQTGRKLKFIKKEGNTIKYWVPPIKPLSHNIWTDIEGYARGWGFKTENSEILLKRVIESTSDEGDLVMDFFLGSGTTTAVAHKLRRKWIGVEMGEHFWTVVLPRMKKVLAYDKTGISKEDDVKERYNEKTAGGFFKYHLLEQYEDALENIEFERLQKELYEFFDYFVKYMLEWETKNSSTFLNIDKMEDPFSYKLKFIENYQQKIVNVDLVETFNYLLGLKVDKYKVLYENGRKYVFVFGEKDGKRVSVVWRSIEDIDFEKDREIIEKTIRESNPDEIYISGEALIKGFKHIEPVFKSLMFEEIS
ncbi:MAG: adenine-specific DNA-methyltransferase [Archaeoglobaceae archaeon]|nr:adenine-specific DNA-methyltransferase [Archaeoglobaceae archaeon]MDK2876621.1 adenine-specific DNA-methyltransferase [Archaeoglobaceae archaeon]